jgi:hypothetical protein
MGNNSGGDPEGVFDDRQVPISRQQQQQFADEGGSKKKG